MDYSDDTGRDGCHPDTSGERYRPETSCRPAGLPGADLAPAYNFGWSQHLLNQRADWEEFESVLAASWPETARGETLAWDEARDAVRAGWDHIRPPARRGRTKKT